MLTAGLQASTPSSGSYTATAITDIYLSGLYVGTAAPRRTGDAGAGVSRLRAGSAARSAPSAKALPPRKRQNRSTASLSKRRPRLRVALSRGRPVPAVCHEARHRRAVEPRRATRRRWAHTFFRWSSATRWPSLFVRQIGDSDPGKGTQPPRIVGGADGILLCRGSRGRGGAEEDIARRSAASEGDFQNDAAGQVVHAMTLRTQTESSGAGTTMAGAWKNTGCGVSGRCDLSDICRAPGVGRAPATGLTQPCDGCVQRPATSGSSDMALQGCAALAIDQKLINNDRRQPRSHSRTPAEGSRLAVAKRGSSSVAQLRVPQAMRAAQRAVAAELVCQALRGLDSDRERCRPPPEYAPCRDAWRGVAQC